MRVQIPGVFAEHTWPINLIMSLVNLISLPGLTETPYNQRSRGDTFTNYLKENKNKTHTHTQFNMQLHGGTIMASLKTEDYDFKLKNKKISAVFCFVALFDMAVSISL